MNIIEINKRIKQRPPFQMVERVLDVVPGESVTALKNVSVNEPYFMGLNRQHRLVHLQSKRTEQTKAQFMYFLK